MRLQTISKLGCGLILMAVAAWIFLSGPMLINIHTGPLSGDYDISIFNPVRDRTPEQYPTEILSKVVSDWCQQAMTELGISEQ